jgi:hypothetical protein
LQINSYGNWEIEKTDLVILGILNLPEIVTAGLKRPAKEMRNLASFVAKEESLSMKHRMHDGLVIEQKVLCIGMGLN